MSKALPDIVVLMPAYNAEAFIQRSIDSLNASTVAHDIVVIDDGSKIPVTDYIRPQDNLTVLRLDPNGGVGNARNRGLEHALEKGYTYMAWLDADDVQTPGRFARQKAFLDENPGIGMVGSWARIVNEAGEPQYFYNTPTGHDEIAMEMYYQNCMFNPSLMFRSSIVAQGLRCNTELDAGGDWEFVRQFVKRTKLANIPDYLIDYTITPGGITQTKSVKKMLMRDLTVQFTHANWLSPHFYLGVLKTLVNGLRMLSKSYKRHKIAEATAETNCDALPVYIRSPLRGMTRIGTKPLS